jgi:hypothetical protein
MFAFEMKACVCRDIVDMYAAIIIGPFGNFLHSRLVEFIVLHNYLAGETHVLYIHLPGELIINTVARLWPVRDKEDICRFRSCDEM